MEYFELIHDFTDGTLNQDKERELFHHLASNDELRTKLKHLIAVKNSVVANSEYFVPPVDATNKIFAALSIGSAIPANIGSPAGFSSSVATLFGKYRQGLVGGLISSVVTAVIILSLFNFHTTGKSDLFMAKNKIIPVNKNIKVESETNYVEKNKKESIKNNTRTVIKYIYRDSKEPLNINPEKISDLPSNANNYLLASSDPVIFKAFSLKNKKIDYEPRTIDKIENKIYSVIPNSGEKKHFSVELKNTPMWNMPKENINPQQFSKFNNMAVSGFYVINDYMSVGLELYQETYFQRYTGYGSNNNGNDYNGNGKTQATNEMIEIKNTYEQQPNFTTFDIALRYSFRSLFDESEIIYPIAQIGFGINNVGSVVRPMAGIVYEPFPECHLLAGVEYSQLQYYFQGPLFISRKFGLNIGFGYNF